MTDLVTDARTKAGSWPPGMDVPMPTDMWEGETMNIRTLVQYARKSEKNSPEEVKDMGTQVDTRGTEVEVSTDEILMRVVKSLNSLDNRMADIEARMQASETATASKAGTPEQAHVEVESTTEEIDPLPDTEVIEPETAEVDGESLIYRRFRNGETMVARTRKRITKQGLEIPKDSFISHYVDEQGRNKWRVWSEDGTSRPIAKAWVENKGNARKVQTPGRQLQRETRVSNAQAQDKALEKYVLGRTVVFAKGDPVEYHKNPRTGQDVAFAVNADGVMRIPPKGSVKDGKLVKGFQADMTHMSKKLRRQVKRHNSGDCTCKPGWACPAAQALGPEPVAVGNTAYMGINVKEHPFDVETAGPSAISRLDAGMWGLDS